MLPLRPPPSILVSCQYRIRHIQYLASGVKIPTHTQSHHPHPPPPHSPRKCHPQYSHHSPCHLFLSRASTKCNTFSFRFLESKFPLLPNLTCLFVQCCSYYLRYITYSTLITHLAPRCTTLHPGQMLYIFLYKYIIVRFLICGINKTTKVHQQPSIPVLAEKKCHVQCQG
jgi:hypothetical protein